MRMCFHLNFMAASRRSCDDRSEATESRARCVSENTHNFCWPQDVIKTPFWLSIPLPKSLAPPPPLSLLAAVYEEANLYINILCADSSYQKSRKNTFVRAHACISWIQGVFLRSAQLVFITHVRQSGLFSLGRSIKR